MIFSHTISWWDPQGCTSLSTVVRSLITMIVISVGDPRLLGKLAGNKNDDLISILSVLVIPSFLLWV